MTIYRFEHPVVPRDVCIYETFNPGAVVRIWGRFTDLDWKLLWEGPPQECPEGARKFHPTIRNLNCLIKWELVQSGVLFNVFLSSEIRIEFNQSHLKYHTSIDAVLLGGYEPKQVLQQHILQKDLLKWTPEVVSKDGETWDDKCDLFSRLPVFNF